MKYFKSILAAAFALSLPSLPSAAAAQCSCAGASLMNTQVATQAAGPTTGALAQPVISTVTPGVELPAAGPLLNLGGSTPRMKIDYGVNTIRVEFLQPAGHGLGINLTFGTLNPTPPTGCVGTPKVVQAAATTAKPGAQVIVSAATFTDHSVTVPFAPAAGNIDWLPGESFLVTLQFACDAASPPPPGGPDPCCPPWSDAQLRSMLFYQGAGPIGAPYTLRFNPTPQLHSQMNAYINYLKSLNPGFASVIIQFELFDGGTGAASVPTGGALATHAITWTGTGNPVPNFLAPGMMQPNRWYRIRTNIILSGGPGTAYLPASCLVRFVDVRLQLI